MPRYLAKIGYSRVATNLAPNFDLEDFLKFLSQRICIKCQLVPKERDFYNIFNATKVPKPVTQTT